MAPYITEITRRFNLIALWVAETIVDAKTLRERSKRWSVFVDIAWVFQSDFWLICGSSLFIALARAAKFFYVDGFGGWVE